MQCSGGVQIVPAKITTMRDEAKIRVDLVDHHDGFRFKIQKSGDGEELELDDFTAEAFKEYGDIFTEGLSLNNAANEQAVTAAITNVSDLLKMVLHNYDSDCTSFKCILASSISNTGGVAFISTRQRISSDIFAENYAMLAVKIFAAMRKAKAGNLHGSNIYRLVHCLVNRGGNISLFTPYAYATFTIFLQACMFVYVFVHSSTNLPKHEESYANWPLAILVLVYQVLLLLPEIRDTLEVNRSGFWKGNEYSVLRFFDVMANVIMPIVLLPIGVLLVMTADNLLEAVLSSTAVLFIPSLDNDIINLMGESDGDTVKKYVAQKTIHDVADHFFLFQIAYEETDGFGDIEQNTYGSTIADRIDSHRMGVHNSSSVSAAIMEEALIEDPCLVDLAVTGAEALSKCVVFEAFCTTRTLHHLHKASPALSGVTTPLKGGRTRDGFSEIPRDAYQEVFFSEAVVVSQSSLFTRMEYKIDDKAPYAILYLKLWRLGGAPGSNTVEYRTKRYSDLYPSHRIEPGCFVITNIAITDCIDTLRICWAPTAPDLLKALNYYTIFNCDDGAEQALKNDQTTLAYARGRPSATRRRSNLFTPLGAATSNTGM
jgi:hypothetical protein